MEGEMPADEDAWSTNQRSGKEREAPDDDGAADPPPAFNPDMVLGDDASNTRQLALPRPEQALAPHRVLGRGNGGRNTPGYIIRDPSQAHQNPVPLQTAHQVTGAPSRLMNLLFPPEQAHPWPQATDWDSPIAKHVLREWHDKLASLQAQQQKVKAYPSSQQPLQQKAETSTSCQPAQQISGHRPGFNLVSYEDFHEGWNLLQETTRQRDQLLLENESLKEKLAQVDQREWKWFCDRWERQQQVTRARDNERLSLSPDQIEDRKEDAAQVQSGAVLPSGEVTLMCRACQVRRASVTLQPCQHRSLCTICYDEHRLVCPFCYAFAT